jgi:hypothetical protein
VQDPHPRGAESAACMGSFFASLGPPWADIGAFEFLPE